MPSRRSHKSRDPDKKDRVELGQLVRQRAMGSDALYRVVEILDDGIRVEVIEAPGLDAGARFVFSTEAVAGMEILYSQPDRPPAPARSETIGRRLA